MFALFVRIRSWSANNCLHSNFVREWKPYFPTGWECNCPTVSFDTPTDGPSADQPTDGHQGSLGSCTSNKESATTVFIPRWFSRLVGIPGQMGQVCDPRQLVTGENQKVQKTLSCGAMLLCDRTYWERWGVREGVEEEILLKRWQKIEVFQNKCPDRSVGSVTSLEIMTLRVHRKVIFPIIKIFTFES